MREVGLLNVEGGRDIFPCYTIKDFPIDDLSKIAFRTNRSKNIKEYICGFGTFDIETTTIECEEPYAFMYHWQMCIDGLMIYGRTWKEWIELLKSLESHYKLSDERKFVIYIHNLGFEFQHMIKFLQKNFNVGDIFSVSSRQPLRMTAGGFEFRCSWKQTNMSLSLATRNDMGVKHPKADGDIDYKVIRTADTDLSDTEFGYCMSDVLSLWELITSRMKVDKDNLETIPMTSTGYVRRAVRKNTQKEKWYRDFFQSLSFDAKMYTLMKDAGRGGDTHANRKYAGRIIEDVYGFDEQSAYPAMLLLKKFPMSKFQRYGEIESKEELNNLINTKACLFRLTLVGNIKLKPEIAMPYISESKCKKLIHPLLDNGRVLRAEYLEIAVTDIDYSIIREQYEFDELYANEMCIAEYGYLPKCITDVVMDFFKLKSELKYKLQHCKKSEKRELEILYTKSKNKLNAIFGMMYTDPVRNVIIYNNGEWKEEESDIEEALKKFFKSRNSFLNYAWGIWTTAHARRHLREMVVAAGEEYSIYNDTDSDYCINPDFKAIDEKNEEIKKQCMERGAYCDIHGERYYLGIYEFDKKYDKFITLGAKKYATERNGEVKITVSGVEKYKGSEELGSIDNFKIGFVFRKAGGKELIYIEDEIHNICVNGCEMESAGSIPTLDSTYRLGISQDYSEIIGMEEIYQIFIKEKKKYEKTSKQRKRKSGSRKKVCRGEKLSNQENTHVR